MTGRSYNELVGLGGEHRKARAAAIATLNPGVDCCPRLDICGGLPMWPTPQAAAAAGVPAWLGTLDLGDWPGRIYGGPQIKRLEHARCNRTAGARDGNRLRALGITRTIRTPRTRTPRRRGRW